MKKSEMARKIQVFLENRGYCGNCDDGEKLLEYILELGMMPPTVYLEELQRFDNGWDNE